MREGGLTRRASRGPLRGILPASLRQTMKNTRNATTRATWREGITSHDCHMTHHMAQHISCMYEAVKVQVHTCIYVHVHFTQIPHMAARSRLGEEE